MDMVSTYVSPILLIGIISRGVGYLFPLDFNILFPLVPFSWGEEILKRKMVKGLEGGWILIWRTIRCREFQLMSSHLRN
jgi:hypothetical protein